MVRRVPTSVNVILDKNNGTGCTTIQSGDSDDDYTVGDDMDDDDDDPVERFEDELQNKKYIRQKTNYRTTEILSAQNCS